MITSTAPKHAEDYSPAVDFLHLLRDVDYVGRHIYVGKHAIEWDYFAEQASHAVWCIDAAPLLPWPKHAKRVSA